MKKKNIILSLAIIALVLLSVYFFTLPEALGNMTQTFSEPTSNTSNISFSGEINERIKFSFRSNVEAGKLDVILYDSNGNVVYELDEAKALETYFTFEETDTYTLEAEYVDFLGSYEVKVYKVN